MTVGWTAEARRELADIWLRADSTQRRAISAAAHAIDRRLAINPDNEGESRSAGRRVLFERPLGIMFRVHQSRAAVRVTRVWKIR